VVPRAWTIAFAEMAETSVPDALPADWLEEATRLAGAPIPATLSDPVVGGDR
jgi:hypothetical protein